MSITAAQMAQTFVRCYNNFETNKLYFIQLVQTNDADWVWKIAPSSLQTSEKN
jgi:hypothetical protein